ncbi:MAG: sugar phosphate isomerase/epimerase [Desulfotomaculum sp.]|nr:sugar phosphate isomerase/epimerase [Desulfotomaculum sp.]MCL0081171.1 sugar phosphate isomerase/epimerase [Peptococcaceae bacterium]
MITGIGINADGGIIGGDLAKFSEIIRYYSEFGFDYIEIPPHGLDVILNGRLVNKRVAETKQILGQFNLKYTIHAPDDLNLGDFKRKEIHYSAFEACIEYADQVGASLIVYHAAVRMPDEEQHSLEKIKQHEATQIATLAAKAAQKGIQIAIENANPSSRDILSPKNHSYGSSLKELADQVKRINKDNVGICLDFGHAYLAANLYQRDFLAEIKYAAPYVNHFHVHDNFGKIINLNRSYMHLYLMGEGDLHLPVAWGEIPYAEIFTAIDFPRPKALVLELKPRFRAEAKECLTKIKAWI